MRVSEYFNLGRSQPSLDFVDVDVAADARVFVDPRSIRRLPNDWAEESGLLLATFFEEILAAIKTGDTARVRELLVRLAEPNETHLGLSVGRSRGRGLGMARGRDLADALSASLAVKTGLLRDLEDSVLMVEGIGLDIVSDITTNVLRGQLIGYTQQVSHMYGIPLSPDVVSGPVWNPHTLSWEEGFVDLPIADGRKLLLVPKALVRYPMNYDRDEYFRNYLTPILQREELDAGSGLVEVLKGGGKRVTKKSIRDKYGDSKLAITRLTLKHPEALAQYREVKDLAVSPPLGHGLLQERLGGDLPDFQALLDAVTCVPTGRSDATRFHHGIEALLSALFYPSLVGPQLEDAIHAGRKRIDITYTNTAEHGFFRWLATHGTPCKSIFVECKNYADDPANPELDQIAGRFSPLRGQVGLLVCRSFKDKERFLDRCRDTARDHRGYVLALDDADLAQLVAEVDAGHGVANESSLAFSLLRTRFNELLK